MVNIFSDMRPVLGPDDPRMGQLEQVATWFMSWEDEVGKSTLSGKEQKAALMSRETRDDTMSLLLGVQELVKNHFTKSCLSLTLGRLNSDIVENFFCQQRAMCHGSNDNPTHFQYSYAINTIILSQAPISKKSNAYTGGQNECSFATPPAKKPKKSAL